MEKEVQICPMEENDRKQFILDNQEAFNYGAMEEFGLKMTILKKMVRLFLAQRSNNPLIKEKRIGFFLKEKKWAVPSLKWMARKAI